MSDSNIQTIRTYSNKARYVFTWTINSLCIDRNYGIYEDSPNFFTADGGIWIIRLYPFGVSYFCSLLRMPDKAPLVPCYDVDFLPKIGDGPPSYSVRAEPFGIGHLLHIPHEIVSLNSATSDFLVFQFRLQRCRRRRKCQKGVIMVSEIQLERSSAEYSCLFEEAMKTRLIVDNEAQDVIENERYSVNGRFSNLEENREDESSEEIFPIKMHCCGLGYAVVALKRSRTKHWGQSRIHLLDIKGRIHASSEVGEHFFRTDSVDLLRYHKLLTAEQIEIDEKLLNREGQLYFIFEIETSNGDSSGVTCEKIYNESCRVSQNSLKDDMIGFINMLRKPDLQIRIGKEMFLAHWAILSARSPFFHTMWKSDMLEKETGFVDMKGIDPKTFRRFINFIYAATFDRDIDCEEMTNLYAVADRFSVDSLKRICSSTLKSQISMGNCCFLLIFSDLHHDNELRNVVEFFIFTHYEKTISSCDWKYLQDQHPKIAENVSEKYVKWRQRFYLNKETDS